MTFDDLSAKLLPAVVCGKIGTPVSLRMHVQLTDSRADLIQTLANAMHVAASVFTAQPATLMARRDANRSQLNLLFSYTNGQVVMLTVGCGSAESPSLHLLLIGDHGVVRLEGAELFDAAEMQSPPDAAQWRSPVATSLAEGQPVCLDAQWA
jgi:hypothetical protein